jgi:hypothetical protein
MLVLSFFRFKEKEWGFGFFYLLLGFAIIAAELNEVHKITA